MSQSLLNTINSPLDLRQLPVQQLSVLADELREFIQASTTEKPGHIRSSLGVVELSIALHYVFNTPEDILVWDVGHQAYAHKILTGRKDSFRSNRMLNGISGFTKRSESKYDSFGAGHSSTAISAATGFATSAHLSKIERNHIAVVGDGALTGGECFEALNYLGEKGLNVCILLNDNSSSIDKNVGALSQYGNYEELCHAFHINFLGEVSGHDMNDLLNALEKIKKTQGPGFLRIITEKGRGYKTPSNRMEQAQATFQDVFTEIIIKQAHQDPKIVAISPAMLSGSGLNKFQEVFPDRTFDTGITEQHAVTMAAALAADGYKPICHLYSTFAQRAYDQIIHDVALQKLPVVFCLDRAGLAGEDGATHHGNFDTGFLNIIPDLTIGAPVDDRAFEYMLAEAFQSSGPVIIRYPKSAILKDAFPPVKNKGIRQLKKGDKKAVISYGAIGAEVVNALKYSTYSHYDLMYIKPLDVESLRKILHQYDAVITIEENSLSGGFGEKCAFLMTTEEFKIRFKALAIPDEFVGQGSREELLEILGLNAKSIRTMINDL